MKNVGIMFEDKLAPLLNTEKGRYFAIATLILVSLLFVWALVDAVMTWHADFIISDHKPTVIATEDASEAMQEMIARTPSQHIFGQSADDDFLPITSLQLHLTGIIQVPESNLSRAIISEGGQSGKIFNVGDELISGIKVYAINPDNVVLEHAGHLEKLPLSRAKLLFQDLPKPLWQQDK